MHNFLRRETSERDSGLCLRKVILCIYVLIISSVNHLRNYTMNIKNIAGVIEEHLVLHSRVISG